MGEGNHFVNEYHHWTKVLTFLLCSYDTMTCYYYHIKCLEQFHF